MVVLSNNSFMRSAAAAGVVIGAQLLSLTVVVGGAVVVGGGIVVGMREINMVKTLVILPIVSSTKVIICDIPANLIMKCAKPHTN